MPSAPVEPAPVTPSGRTFGAVMLDLDGTLIDSIGVVVRSWAMWCEEFGVDPQDLAHQHGVTAANVIAALLPEEVRERAHDRIVEIEVADTDGIEVLPGALEMLQTLAAGGVPTAIVTSGTHPLAWARLEATGLPAPEVVVTATDVERGKPWPDPWLKAAAQLGVDPADCLVIEDAVAGITAARDAGVGMVAAVTTSTPRARLAEVADVVVANVAELGVGAEGGRAFLGQVAAGN